MPTGPDRYQSVAQGKPRYLPRWGILLTVSKATIISAWRFRAEKDSMLSSMTLCLCLLASLDLASTPQSRTSSENRAHIETMAEKMVRSFGRMLGRFMSLRNVIVCSIGIQGWMRAK